MNKEKNSRKYIKRKRKEIYENIKQEYKNNEGLLDEEPKSVRFWGWCFFIFGIISIIVYLVSLIIKSFIPACVVIGILFLISVENIILEIKYKSFHRKKASDMMDLCAMVLEDEAKKYDTTKEVLSLYLTKKYEYPFILKLFLKIIPVLGTAFAVLFLPGFDRSEGILYFIILVFVNVIISWGAEKVCDELKFLE